MTRRFSILIIAAALVALPLAAQDAGPDTGEAERTEDGTLTGTVVLLDEENVIVETGDGDRAFAINADTTLSTALRDTDDWTVFEGVPVRVTFIAGAPGELRVARSVELLATDDAAATTAAVQPTDFTDEGVAVEPDEVDTESALEQDVEAAVAEVDEAVDEAVQNADDAVEEDEEIQTALAEADEDIDQAVQDADDAVEEDEEIQTALTEADEDIDEAVQDDDVEGQLAQAELPATAASPIHWLGLIGSLSLVGALGVGRLERHRRWRQARASREGR
jgi:hypothetical protein